MSERRRFNKGERAALYLAADGRCAGCGKELSAGWHADHVHPHVRGGPTDVINGQALCPNCNLQKGSSVTTALREWQVRALEDLSEWKPTGDNGFLLEATPGAGKTRWTIAAAERAFEAGTIDRIVIAVPTARLESQWSEEFDRYGFNVNPDWHSSIGVLPADEHGCVATYAEIAKQPAVFRKLVSQRRTLAVLDEVHHCGGDRAWASGVYEAFRPAKVRLLLSGTPFRSDNYEIPFVNYVDGTGVPDHRYGYAQALDDQVVRAVWFPRRGGRAEWIYRNKEYAADFDDKLNQEDANRRLRTAISTKGDWLPSVLADADQQLAELRSTDPVAAGIVFCEDKDAASAITRMLTGMGRDVVLVTSDEPESKQRIVAFRDGVAPWLVSIRQVSEGVDIPRLRVGVYATNYLTEMFFRQALGRLVRRQPEDDDPTAYLFIPDDERLRAMAETIRKTRDHILNRQLEEQLRIGSEDNNGLDSGQEALFRPVASVAADRGVIIDSDTITPEQYAEADRIKRLESDTAALPTPLAAKLLKQAGYFSTTQLSSPAPPPSKSLKDRKDGLFKQNRTTTTRIVNDFGLEYGYVNGALNAAVGVEKLRQCTEDQAIRRLALAKQWLTGGPPRGVS